MGPRELWRRLRAMVRYQPIENDLAEELEAHLELATKDYVSRGMGEREARRAALIDLGGIQQAKELHRENRGLPALEQLWHDLRLAVRSLRRDSQLTAFSVSIIGLGVAASTLVFSVGTALLVRPLPFQDPERLVWVANGEASNLSAQTIQVGNLLDLRQNSRTLAEMAGFNAFYGPGDIHLDDDQGPPQRTTGVPITEGLLSLLGVEPLLGRGFTHREVVGREPVTLLGHRLWQTRYDGDPQILGRTVRLDGKPTTVVGVLPEAFDFERILTPGRRADLFLPFALDAQTNRRGNTLAVIGRLAPGVDVDTAQNELSILAADIGALSADPEKHGFERRNSVRPRLIPLHERISGNTRSSLFLLGGAVGLPFGDNFGWRSWSARADHWSRDVEAAKPLVRVVDDGYWQTLGLRLLAGRTIESGDRSRSEGEGEEPAVDDRVVVINETLAEILWPEAGSWNEVLSRGLVTSGRQYRVVGVVSEARYFSLEKPSGPEMYFSFRQVADMSSVDLVMRTRGNSDDALPAIRLAMAAAAPDLPLTEPFTLEGLVDQATYRRRAVLGVLSGFGGFGLLLAVLGVYCVIAYTVAQSRRSIGVRMAFGATGEQVSRELVWRMLKPITLGTVTGLVLAFWLAEMAASQLYGVSPSDPLTFGLAALGLVSSGLAAAYFPAKGAARLEVVEVLREH